MPLVPSLLIALFNPGNKYTQVNMKIVRISVKIKKPRPMI